MPVLLSALDDDRIWHEPILNALADIGDRRVVAAATAMIGERSDAKVRIVAVRVLGACGGEAEAIALVTHLSSDDSDLRRALSAALVTIGARAVGPILDRFSTLDERGRTAAAQALGSIGGPRAIEALVSAVHDPGDFVRRAAVEALGDTDGWVRVAAAHALGQRDDLASLEGLLVALKDENYEVRRAAAGSLG